MTTTTESSGPRGLALLKENAAFVGGFVILMIAGRVRLAVSWSSARRRLRFHHTGARLLFAPLSPLSLRLRPAPTGL